MRTVQVRLGCYGPLPNPRPFGFVVTSHPMESQINPIQWNIENFLIVLDELNPTLDMDQVSYSSFNTSAHCCLH